MEILFSFLVWASSFSMMDEGEGSGSKMDTHNLATVIAPNILKGRSPIMGQDEESFLAIEVVNTLIQYNDEMCEVSVHYSMIDHTLAKTVKGTGGPPIHPERLITLQQFFGHYHQRDTKTVRRYRSLGCTPSSDH